MNGQPFERESERVLRCRRCHQDVYPELVQIADECLKVPFDLLALIQLGDYHATGDCIAALYALET